MNPQEEHVEHDAEAEHGQVHPLDRLERVGVLALEEESRRDERAGKGRDALEALADVEPHRGVARGAEHGDVRVGGYLEAGEAASDDKGAADETAVLSEFGGRPEKDRTWVFVRLGLAPVRRHREVGFSAPSEYNVRPRCMPF